jgi:hypothetical protein
MSSIAAHRRVPGRSGPWSCPWLLLVLASAPAVRAEAPLDPLPVPDYSFDLSSWTVAQGIVDARDVLYLDFPHPGRLLPGLMLQLYSSADDLDALSSANATLTELHTFALLFSVSAAANGVAPPDPALIELNVPYNVTNQAALGQAGGDQFMSTQLFTLNGALDGWIFNNVLARNNYDEGGTDFSAQPDTPACELADGSAYDNLNATGRLERLGEEVANVYFSLVTDSPSLDTMPYWGNPSGADIYFNESPPTYQPTDLYTPYEYLQLVEQDDIDAVVVFDTNQNVAFDESDVVLFSLAPGSPSLATIPGASAQGAAADVFVVRPGQMPAVFASAAQLGLGDPQDDIDALDFVLCDDALLCAAQHGIRAARGDLDGDCDVDLADLCRLLAAYGSCQGDPDYDPMADLDLSGCVSLADLAALLGAYGTTCD